MFKDTDRELARLSEELLMAEQEDDNDQYEEEEDYEDYDEEFEEAYEEEYEEDYEDDYEDEAQAPPEYIYDDTRAARGPAVYQNYSNDYGSCKSICQKLDYSVNVFHLISTPPNTQVALTYTVGAFSIGLVLLFVEVPPKTEVDSTLTLYSIGTIISIPPKTALALITTSSVIIAPLKSISIPPKTALAPVPEKF